MRDHLRKISDTSIFGGQLRKVSGYDSTGGSGVKRRTKSSARQCTNNHFLELNITDQDLPYDVDNLVMVSDPG